MHKQDLRFQSLQMIVRRNGCGLGFVFIQICQQFVVEDFAILLEDRVHQELSLRREMTCTCFGLFHILMQQQTQGFSCALNILSREEVLRMRVDENQPAIFMRWSCKQSSIWPASFTFDQIVLNPLNIVLSAYCRDK